MNGAYQEAAWGVIREVEKAVVGKDQVIEKIMTAILAGGHILVEDMPGTGKTTMALAFSRAMGLKEKRVQFTPDVLPSDLTGFTIYKRSWRNLFISPERPCAISFWRMRSTALRPRPSPLFWR